MHKTFEEIENIELRTWNQCATYFNLSRDFGIEAGKNYIDSLSFDCKVKIKRMLTAIRDNGYSEIKRKVVSGEHVAGDC